MSVPEVVPVADVGYASVGCVISEILEYLALLVILKSSILPFNFQVPPFSLPMVNLSPEN